MNRRTLLPPIPALGSTQGRRYSKVFSFLLGCVLPLSVQAQSIVQEYYVPMPEAQIRQSFQILATGVGASMDSVVSMVVGASGTKVVYDHWEDGYEVNINAPVQASTQIWGDGNNANGKPPGFANDPASLDAGTVIALRNLVSLPRNPGVVLYDGRDRVGATKGIVMSRAAWATNPGSVLADATEVSSTLDWGSSFVMPVGENEIFPTPATNSMFEMASLFVQASQNGTVVQVDKDANGVAEISVTLNQGENYYLDRGVLRGATVTSSKPVQVHLLTGDIGANYESRWFSIPPRDQWGSSYYSPIGTASDGDDTYIFLYNPDPAAITVNFDTRVSSGNFSIPARSTYRFLMPQESGAHFYNALGKPFFAVGAVGAEPTANNVHDWGFSLVPEGNLTTAAVVGWGPGSSDLSANGSPVWVTTLKATRLYVDYNGDRQGPLTDPEGAKYDVHYDVNPLVVTRLYDPDRDQTGMRIYTLNGSLLTAAWGQDPAVAGAGNPFLDMGTTVPAFPVPVIHKTATIITDLNTPGPSVGDTMEYAITMDNQSLVALGNVLVMDGLPPQLSYQAGTTTRDGVAVPDSAAPTTLFPLDESGIIVPILPRGQSTVIRYRTTITGTGEIINNVGTSFAGVRASSNVPVSTGGTQCTLQFTNNTGTAVTAYAANSGIYLSLNDPDLNKNTTVAETIGVLVRNTTNSDYEFVLLTETGPNTHIFSNALTPLPSSTTAGLGPDDGTLNASPTHNLTASHVDPIHGETCTANAVISVPSLTKQLYLDTDGSDGDLVADLDRVLPTTTTGSSTSALSLPTSSVVLNSTTSASVNNATSLTFAHTVSSNANRLLLVGVTVGATASSNVNPPTVTTVTYGGVPMAQVGTRWSGTAGANDDAITYIYRLLAPASGTANVVVTVNATGVILAGASSFSNVNQTTPLGNYESNAGLTGNGTITLASGTGDIVYSVIGADERPTITIPAPQASQWNIVSTLPVSGAASTTAGATSVTHNYTLSTQDQDWSVSAVAIKPAPAPVGAPAIFTQTPAFAENFVMPGGASLGAEVFFSVVSGTMPASPNITAVIKRGATVVSTSSAATSSGGKLTFAFPVLASNVTVPVGQALSLEISTAQAGVSFTLDYDSQTKRSMITLPTNTVIHTDSIGVYDAPYPGGNVVTTPTNGQTLYVRTQVGDPFGAYDITSLQLMIDGPSTGGDITTVLGAAEVVATTAATKTYEYVWHTGTVSGAYNVAATAREGFENSIRSEKSTAVTLSYLDLGTPSVTTFSKKTYATNENVCVTVTDIDQNANAAVAETVMAVITSSAGDLETVVLTETGVNTGVFTYCIPASSTVVGANNNGTIYAPQGTALVVTYIDPDDSSDTSSDNSAVPQPPGTPGISLTKTLIAPADGQVIIGEAMQFRLRVVNTGSTVLSTVALSDTYPAANLQFVSASVAPNTSISGSLAWTNVGPLNPGQNVDVLINFTALASANPAVNSATVNAGGGVTSTRTANVVITRPGVTVLKTLVSPNPGPANKGDNVVFNIRVTNTGDTAISSLPVEDLYSGAYFEFVSAVPAPDASGSGSLLWLDITGSGSLAPAAFQDIAVTLRALGAANPATNRAAVDFATDANGDSVPPASSQASLTTNAASISGHVYEDRGSSGFDVDDVPLSGVTVSLYSDPNGDGDPADGVLLAISPTLANGSYEFLNLALGNYVVVETDPLGYQSVIETDGDSNNRIAVTLTTFSPSTDHNFLDAFIDPANYGNLEGQVRNDVDADGNLNDAEAGISGVTIELYTDPNGDGDLSDGTLFASTVTDGTGHYHFNLIPPGSYVVVETDPAGYVSTSDRSLPNDNRIAATLFASQTNSGNDFLDTNNTAALGVIGNLVWSDTNNDGIRNVGENGIDGVLVQLYRASHIPGVDAPYLTTTTAGGGLYSFANLPAEDYVVYFPVSNFTTGGLQNARLSSTTTVTADNHVDNDDNGIQSAHSQPVTSPILQISAGETENTVDFGFVPNSSLGSISGQVRNDADADGDLTDSEVGISGVTIQLYTDPNGDGSPSDGVLYSSLVTDGSGHYSFDFLPAGSYLIVETDPAGFVSTSDKTLPNDNGIPVALAISQASTGNDFLDTSNTAALGVIGNQVWRDTNNDGIQNVGETGINTVRIELYRSTQTPGVDAPYLATTTAGGGVYSFANVPAGSYVLYLPASNFTTGSLQTALLSSTTTVTLDNQVDSDDNGIQTASSQPVRSPVIVLSTGETDNTVDFGFVPNSSLGSIAGQVRNDTDADGDLADAESGVSGVTIQLYTDPNGDGNPADGVLYTSGLTNGTGNYSFTFLPPGRYVVVETDPVGAVSTSDRSLPNDNRIPVNLAAAQASTGNDFLDTTNLAALGVLGNLVWSDVNNDGIHNVGEPGIDGVLVQLYRASQTPGVDAPYTSTTTAGGGLYSFANVPAGSYVIYLPASNFTGGALQTASLSSTQTVAVDNQVDNDDNGIQTARSQPVRSPTIVVSAGESDNSVDFGFVPDSSLGSIAGQVRNDTDADGELADAESGIAGVTIQLYTDPNGDGNPADGVLYGSTLTTGTGDYVFNLVPAGRYVIVETDPSGFVSTNDKTLPNDNRIPLTLATSQVSSGNDFLDTNNTAALGVIGNLVWSDTNNNGIRNGGEPGVDGVLVQLYRSSQTPGVDVPFLSTTTTGGGVYSFANVPAGSYVIYLPVSNFSGGALQTAQLSSLTTATVDNQVDNDDNGIQAGRAQAVSSPVIVLSAGETENTVDFGFVPDSSLGSIAGQVRNDTDADGDLADADAGTDGVTVQLYTDPNGDGDPADGVLYASTVTSGGGSYSFNFLPAGNYVVVETDPVGSVSTGDKTMPNDNRIAVTLTAAQSSTGNDFLNTTNTAALGVLGNLVWGDVNNDGLYNVGETGIDGVLVQLYRSTQTPGVDVPFASTTTTSGGVYGFANIPVGSYVIYLPASNFTTGGLQSARLSSTTTVTTDNQVDDDDNGIQSAHSQAVSSPVIVISAGEDDSTVDFGFVPNTSLGSIAGQVRDDADADGDLADIEAGIGGVTVQLYTDPNGDGNPADGVLYASTVTNGSGGYLFNFVPAGNYVVVEIDPVGHVSTADKTVPNDNRIGLVLAAAQNTTDNDFLDTTNTAALGVIGNLVWSDTNNDGIHNVGEPGIDGVLVQLYRAAQTPGVDAPFLSTTTAGGGAYSFANVPAGSYVIYLPVSNFGSSGALHTAQLSSLTTVTLDNQVDNDDNGIQAGRAQAVSSPVIVISAGETENTVDFGFVPDSSLGSIAGQVRDDADADGDLTDTEAGTDGVTVELYTDPNGDGNPADGVLYGSTVTSGGGNYSFEFLPAGSYVIVETDPAGAVSTSDKILSNDNRIPVTLTAGQSSTGNDFLDTTNTAALGVIGNLVWSDVNNDGLYNVGETGIDGVLVQLYRSTQTPGVDVPFTSTTTTGGGVYSFADVPVGSYVIYLPVSNFTTGGLQSARLSSTTTVTTDNQVDDDDNGIQSAHSQAVSSPVIVISAGEDDSTVDFGFVPTSSLGSIAGQVRDDADADGDLGDSESGIGGVTVQLYTDPNGDGDPSDGVLYASTVTNGSGDYVFNFLPTGNYVVVEVDPVGSVSTADKTLPNDNRIGLVLAAGQNSTGNDFLDTTNAAGLGVLGNLVWSDVNNDGLRNVGEPGIDGVLVQLYRAAQTPGVDVPYLSTTTTGGGVYSFANVPAGSYVIYLPESNFSSGALQTSPLSSTVTVTTDNQVDDDDNGIQVTRSQPVSSPVIVVSSGENDNSVDFGFVPNSSLGSIAGTVSDDQNNDNTGDAPLVNVVLTLKDSNGLDIDSDPVAPGVQPTTTLSGVDGSYSFTQLPPGTYRVVEADPVGFISVTPNTVTPVVVTAGANLTGIDFVDERPGTIGNLVWHDANNDGLKGPLESGIDGVVIELLDGSGNAIDSDLVASGVQPTVTTTAGGGLYGFANLAPGTYRLRIATPPAAYPLSSTTTNTADDQVDDDDNGIQATPSAATLSPVISLATGEVENTIDFGFTAIVGGLSISGQVRDDYDLDGNFGDNDQPVAGVRVRLYADTNSNGAYDAGVDLLIGTTTTNSLGEYSFNGLPDGVYFVEEVDPQGASSTGDSQGLNDNLIMVTLAGSNSTGNDFLDAVDPSGYAYDVVTGQIVAGGSISVSGPGAVTIMLDGSSGQYSFITDGTPGTYTLSYLPPLGYVIDPDRPVAGPIFDPTGGPDPTSLGSHENPVNPGYLISATAVGNPYYLNFSLASGDPLVINNNIPLRLQVPKTYDYWKGVTGGGGPTPGSNGDGDCYTDLVEYALNLNPSSGVQTTPAFRGVRNTLTGRLDVSFNRIAGGLNDVTYTLVGITDLTASPAGWAPLSLTPTVTANGDGTETVTYADVESDPLFASVTQGFVRLSLELDQDGNSVTDATGSTPAFGWTRRIFDAECVMTGHPYLKDKNFCGTVDAVVGGNLNVATSAGGSSIVAQFVPNRKYYVEVFSGDHVGHRFEIDEAASTATVIALEPSSLHNTLPSIPATLAGDKVIIREHFTLNELFPSTEFTATNSVSTADRLMFYDRVAGSFKIYWLFANGGNPRWVLSGTATLDDEGGRVIDPSEGWFTHPKTSPHEVVWHGMVRANPFAVPLSAGANFIGSGFPMDQSPIMRGMTVAAGFAGSNDPVHADQLLFWKGYLSTQAMAYFNHFLLRTGSLQYWTSLDDATLVDENNLPMFKATSGCIYKMRTGLPGYVMPMPWTP